jgi:hypothetical protein
MAGILILLIVFACIVIALLTMPVHVRINTKETGTPDYKPAFLRLDIDLDAENLVSVTLYIFFAGFTWASLPARKNRQPLQVKLPRMVSRFGRLKWNRLRYMVNISWQLIKKSRVKKLYLDVDTSNVILNASLYPVFELISDRPRINLNINYSGNFQLCLDMQNNLLTFIRIMIRDLIKRSINFSKK